LGRLVLQPVQERMLVVMGPCVRRDDDEIWKGQ
jgi:3-deoxy-D-arabino-heptulosonate 7-phosphate (DAHP) synthase